MPCVPLVVQTSSLLEGGPAGPGAGAGGGRHTWAQRQEGSPEGQRACLQQGPRGRAWSYPRPLHLPHPRPVDTAPSPGQAGTGSQGACSGNKALGAQPADGEGGRSGGGSGGESGAGAARGGGFSRQQLEARSPSPSTQGGVPSPASRQVFLLLPGRRPAFSGSCFLTGE